ncbi:MAG: Sir2 silent information regulator family NAD-dependent deacetylase [Clostridia bacterium]|nr:Sir2 silent information regulator family NAD-dependent deacetylase [Clostridia bacterium]
MKYTIETLKKLINEADAIVIGAGAGVSAAAGFEYGGEFFKQHFPDMAKIGYTDMYSAGFHNFPTSEAKWGYWCRHIYYCRYQGVKKLYVDLFNLIKDKNYFVLTTNVDHQFQLAGFAKDRLFYTQGDYGLLQCSKPCHQKTYDNENIVLDMMNNLKDYKIPSSFIPKCPVCGEEMSTNLRADDTFVQDDGWYKASDRYYKFINDNKDKKVLFLELGVGWNTPGIIKIPFIQMTHQCKDAYYVVINKGDNYIPKEIEAKAIVINDDINAVISSLQIN